MKRGRMAPAKVAPARTVAWPEDIPLPRLVHDCLGMAHVNSVPEFTPPEPIEPAHSAPWLDWPHVHIPAPFDGLELEEE